jgi:hypothetical protein
MPGISAPEHQPGGQREQFGDQLADVRERLPLPGSDGGHRDPGGDRERQHRSRLPHRRMPD